MTDDTKFWLSNGVKEFWKSMNLYSPLETAGIILTFIALATLGLITLNFLLSAFFGNVGIAWWSPCLQ